MMEEYWANSQFSVARYTGHIKAFGHEYVIVNKEGIDIFALSIMAAKTGKAMAIESGEPADLVRKDFQALYHKLGRDAFIQVLRDNPNSDDKDVKRKMQALIDDKKSERRKKKDNQLTLF